MKHLQNFIGGWNCKMFDNDALALAKHLRKESDELIAELAQSKVAQRKENIEGELADIIILTCGAAYRLGVDLESATMKKMAVNMSRKWGNPDKDGIVEHIK